MTKEASTWGYMPAVGLTSNVTRLAFQNVFNLSTSATTTSPHPPLKPGPRRNSSRLDLNPFDPQSLQVSILVPGIYSTNLRVDSLGDVKASEAQDKHRNGTLIFTPAGGQVSLPYWMFKDVVQIRVVTAKVAPDIAGSGTSGSVIAIYLGVIYTIGRFLRLVFQDASKRIIYEELPDTNLLQDLINGIYIARIHGKLDTEYKLYFQLVQIFRSPEMLLDVTEALNSRHGSEQDESQTCHKCNKPIESKDHLFCPFCSSELPASRGRPITSPVATRAASGPPPAVALAAIGSRHRSKSGPKSQANRHPQFELDETGSVSL